MDVRRAGWVVLFLLAGCTSGNELAVDVRTDLVPGVEFDGVRVTVEGQAPVERLARSGEDYGAPRRVAELTGLAPGRHVFQVELVQDGRPVLQRRVSVRLEGNLIVVVVLSRDCRGVMCPRDGDDPTETECLGGRCVDPSCSEVDPALCGDAECTGASDCAPSAACVMPACVEGACLELPNTALCTADEYCQPGEGCVPLPGGGDAGMPSLDAGVDAGTDAGSGCVEGAPCDTGEPCAVGRVVCEDGAPRCATDGPAPADTVCRPAAGPCDVAERCGGATTCPPDALAGPEVQCRASARECDAAERCTGASVECPADGASPDGSTCGSGVCSSGSCVPCSSGLPCVTGRVCELGTLDCSSGSPVCRSAGPRPVGTLCRDAVGPCDRAEQCNGSSLDCPADGFLAGSTTCRASIGPCDVADTCDGSGPACPVDRFASAGTTCRDALGPCDVPDTCSPS
jgi:hypothetical protein